MEDLVSVVRSETDERVIQNAIFNLAKKYSLDPPGFFRLALHDPFGIAERAEARTLHKGDGKRKRRPRLAESNRKDVSLLLPNNSLTRIRSEHMWARSLVRIRTLREHVISRTPAEPEVEGSNPSGPAIAMFGCELRATTLDYWPRLTQRYLTSFREHLDRQISFQPGKVRQNCVHDM